MNKTLEEAKQTLESASSSPPDFRLALYEKASVQAQIAQAEILQEILHHIR